MVKANNDHFQLWCLKELLTVLFQWYFCCFSRITKPHVYSDSASLSFTEILKFVLSVLSKETKWYFCLQRPKFSSHKNTKLGYHGNNSSLILTREPILTSQNGNNFWNQGWPCMQKKSRIKLEIILFFSDVPMYLDVSMLKIHQQFSTYSLVIDGNGIKRSIVTFWKEIVVSWN